MNRTLTVIGAMLAASVAVAAVIVGMPALKSQSEIGPGSGFDESASLDERLQALEAAVSAEREARQLLEDELVALYEVIDGLEARGAGTGDAGLVEAGRREAVTQAGISAEPRAGEPTRRRDDSAARRAALTGAGFSPDRADWILRRESELQMEAMQARFERMQSGDPAGPFDPGTTPDNLLRAEIGDAEYEMYLDANDRPTSVNVRQVLESSPALSAGLQPGDRITHYDGERVFSTFDLTRQALDGEAGESVVVNILRDGVPMQVVMPRGPLGISIGRGRSR